MNNYVIAFDVGGSFIKSVILYETGELILDSFAIYPAKSKESKEKIIDNLFFRIKQQMNRMLDGDGKLLGIGFAFPGPFDYESGISYIKGIDKFEHLYGVNIRYNLIERINQDKQITKKISNNFCILFENDASLFALGEQVTGKGKNYNKTMYLTIGTGAGSAFIENGQLVKQDPRVPENGWIYNEPFKDSIIDDYISKRGILRLAAQYGICTKDKDVVELAALAKSNNITAKKVFHIFGQYIGDAVNPYISNFSPEALIIGGQISKSKDLFIKGIFDKLLNKNLIIKFTDDTSKSTFQGVVYLIKQFNQTRS